MPYPLIHTPGTLHQIEQAHRETLILSGRGRTTSRYDRAGRRLRALGPGRAADEAGARINGSGAALRATGCFNFSALL
jgi:hypothetical protein